MGPIWNHRAGCVGWAYPGECSDCDDEFSILRAVFETRRVEQLDLCADMAVAADIEARAVDRRCFWFANSMQLVWPRRS